MIITSVTAMEIAHQAKKAKPYTRYAASTDGTTVGAWDAKLDRWVAVAGKLLDNTWASMPFELLVNGVNPTLSLEFTEVY